MATSPAVESALDWIFFVLGGAAALWLAWVLFRESFGFGWWQILFVVGFWVALAYLLLPRLHRILTHIYVPDYFIGRARTSDGLLGDPVNLALLGSEAQVHQAMLAAGWIRADDLSLRTGLRIVRSTILRRSYLEAPVSPLLLFGRKQDFAYQQEVDGSPGKRHHVRFWRCPDGWPLPGGHRTDWLAAGTYDRSVGFSLFTLQITHKIAADTDTERDHIVSTITAVEASVTVRTIKDFSSGYHARNGGGDSIITDGDLPVVDLNSVVAPIPEPDAVPTDSRDRRPAATIVGAVLVAVSGLVTVLSAFGQALDSPATVLQLEADIRADAQVVVLIVAGFVAVIGIIDLIVAWSVFIGRGWARLLAMSLSVLAITAQIIASETGDTATVRDNLPSICLDVLVLLALSSERALVYVHRKHKAPKRVSGRPGNVAAF